METTQMPEVFRTIIDDQVGLYHSRRVVENRAAVPETSEIPIEDQLRWLKIPDVICVFVDMLGSTRLSATEHDLSTAGAYQLFTGTAVRLFHEFSSPYIDVRGDGVFALFDPSQLHTSIAAAVTFKTFAEVVFAPTVKAKTGLEVGCHIGIDQETVLVRKIGLKRKNGRTDRQNEVWAGKPVNMAAKLASLTAHGELLASSRFLGQVTSSLVLRTCGCPDGAKVNLWSEADLSTDSRFDFAKAFRLKSKWCERHGAEYCERILALD